MTRSVLGYMSSSFGSEHSIHMLFGKIKFQGIWKKLVQNCSYHYLDEMVKAVGWFGGDVPTSCKWVGTNFPKSPYG